MFNKRGMVWVLRRPLRTPLTGLLPASEKVMHGAHRTQILSLFQKTMAGLGRRLITIGFAVQRVDDGGLFRFAQRSGLRGVLA